MWLRSRCRYERKQTRLSFNEPIGQLGRQTPKQIISWQDEEHQVKQGPESEPPTQPWQARLSQGEVDSSPLFSHRLWTPPLSPWWPSAPQRRCSSRGVPDPGSWNLPSSSATSPLRTWTASVWLSLGPLPPGITSNTGSSWPARSWESRWARGHPQTHLAQSEGWKVTSPEYPAVPRSIILS